MKTTLDLPEDLMRELKIRAATEGRKLKDVLADAIRGSLAATTPPKTLRIVNSADGGLPHFECAPPSETTPSHEEIQQLLAQSYLEEDLQRANLTL